MRSGQISIFTIDNHNLYYYYYLTKQIDLGNVPTKIYIDLSEAFETLDHSILLDKLSYFDICGVENLMLRTYLSNRHQYVEYNGSKSETKSISIGVPQGSILGPLFFLYTLMTYLESVVSSVC